MDQTSGHWSIVSAQKPIRPFGGSWTPAAHNYLKVINPDGNVVHELHGVSVRDGKLAHDTDAAHPETRLHILRGAEGVYMGDKRDVGDPVTVFSGPEREIMDRFDRAHEALVQATGSRRGPNGEYQSDHEHKLNGVNSNSGWYSGLKNIELENPADIHRNGRFAPGDDTNLFTRTPPDRFGSEFKQHQG